MKDPLPPPSRPLVGLVIALLLVLLPTAALAVWAAVAATRSQASDRLALAATLPQVAGDAAQRAVDELRARLEARVQAIQGAGDAAARLAALGAAWDDAAVLHAGLWGSPPLLPVDQGVLPQPTAELVEARRLDFVVGDAAAAHRAYQAALASTDPAVVAEARSALVVAALRAGDAAGLAALLRAGLAAGDPPALLAAPLPGHTDLLPEPLLFAVWQRLDERTPAGRALATALTRRPEALPPAARAEIAGRPALRTRLQAAAAMRERLPEAVFASVEPSRCRWHALADGGVVVAVARGGPVAWVVARPRVWVASITAAVATPAVSRLLERAVTPPPTVAVSVPWLTAGTLALAPQWPVVAGSGDRSPWLPWLVSGSALLAILAGAFLAIRAVLRELAVARLKEDYAARVSHELRTPLAVVQLNAEMLALGYARDEGERQRCLDVLLGEVRRLGLLVDSALDLARIARGQRRYRQDACDLVGIGQAALSALRPLLDRDAFRVETALPEQAPVRGDGDALTLAVMNLIANAHKFSTGERLVHLTVVRDGGMWRLAVRDAGCGIPADELPHLFTAFHRGSTAGTTRGAGLGLPLVQHVARGHGGRIEVASTPGQGSTFSMLIPATDA